MKIFDITKFCGSDVSKEVLGYVYVKEIAGGFIYVASDSYSLLEITYFGDFKIKNGFYTKAIWKEVVKLFNKKDFEQLKNYKPREDLEFPEYEQLFKKNEVDFDFNNTPFDLDKLYNFVSAVNKIKVKPNFIIPKDYKMRGIFLSYENHNIRGLLAPLML